MPDNKQFNDALGVIGAFVAAHSELDPARIEGTVSTILEFLKHKKLKITVANMKAAWVEILNTLDAVKEKTDRPLTPQEIKELAHQISQWSAAEMKRNMLDPDIAKATNNVLEAQQQVREQEDNQ